MAPDDYFKRNSNLERKARHPYFFWSPYSIVTATSNDFLLLKAYIEQEGNVGWSIVTSQSDGEPEVYIMSTKQFSFIEGL